MTFTLILAVVDAAVVVASFVTAYYFRFAAVPLMPGVGQPSFEPYLYPLPVVVALWLVMLKALGLYGRYRDRFGFDTLLALFGVTLLGTVFLGAVGFVYRGFSYSRLVLATAAVFTFAGLVLARAVAVQVRGYLLQRGVGARRTVVVGTSPAANDLCGRLSHGPASDYYLVGAVVTENGANGDAPCPILGRVEDFFEIITRENVQVVFFAANLPQPVLLELVLECDLKGIDVRIVPSTIELMASKIYADDALGIPVFALRQFRLTGFNRALKRLSDVVFATACLAFFSPFMALIAALIRLTSPGPVFYRQERVGQDGRVFRLFKFRSMVADAERATGPVFARENDERVTRVGRFLRRTSLDELPQFFHVLTGDMSVVGPRPERPMFVEKFASDVPRYLERHKVKSGMTGWAQVSGFRGNTSIARRVEYDMYYIENWSLLFDLRIILRTMWHVVLGTGR